AFATLLLSEPQTGPALLESSGPPVESPRIHRQRLQAVRVRGDSRDRDEAVDRAHPGIVGDDIRGEETDGAQTAGRAVAEQCPAAGRPAWPRRPVRPMIPAPRTPRPAARRRR